MTKEPINSWVEKAKSGSLAADVQENSGVKVVRREATPSRGNRIMELADKLWPGLLELFEGVRDNSGMLLQPAHIRGIALNMAQDLIKKRENNNNA